MTDDDGRYVGMPLDGVIARQIAEYRADLRAKVEALVEYGCPEWNIGPSDEAGRHLRRDEVLALIDGQGHE